MVRLTGLFLFICVLLAMREVAGEEGSSCMLLYSVQAVGRIFDLQCRDSVARFVV